MARDLSGISTEDLQAEYDAAQAKARELIASVQPLRAELTERHNKRTLIRNAVMAGQTQLLLAVGASKEAIAEAEKWVAEDRARKRAARGDKAVQS